jgi:hypothetical protein
MTKVVFRLTRPCDHVELTYEGKNPYEGVITVSGEGPLVAEFAELVEEGALETIADLEGLPSMAERRGCEYAREDIETDGLPVPYGEWIH